MEEGFSIINKTKTRLGRFTAPAGFKALKKLKNSILGKDYYLSMALVGEEASRKINKKYRNKNRPANVLSFSLHKNAGEIIICPAVAKKDATKFSTTLLGFLKLLSVHGMLHLKGMRHGPVMEKLEKKHTLRAKF